MGAEKWRGGKDKDAQDEAVAPMVASTKKGLMRGDDGAMGKQSLLVEIRGQRQILAATILYLFTRGVTETIGGGVAKVEHWVL